jgi:hypothetical protein
VTTPASFSSTSYSPDKLLAGEQRLASRKVTLAAGENRTRGAVLGKVTAGTPTAAAVAGNSGTGTIGAVTLGAGAKPGVYRLTCIEPATDAGKFQVEDPDGIVLGVATVGVAFAGPVNFTIADGGTDFAAGDSFTITVAAGAGTYKLSAAAAADGSQVPDAILAQDCDASGGATEALVYIRGDFNESALTLGAGHTVDSIREGLRQKGIHLVTVQGA